MRQIDDQLSLSLLLVLPIYWRVVSVLRTTRTRRSWKPMRCCKITLLVHWFHRLVKGSRWSRDDFFLLHSISVVWTFSRSHVEESIVLISPLCWIHWMWWCSFEDDFALELLNVVAHSMDVLVDDFQRFHSDSEDNDAMYSLNLSSRVENDFLQIRTSDLFKRIRIWDEGEYHHRLRQVA